jgi:hypothetical protein
MIKVAQFGFDLNFIMTRSMTTNFKTFYSSSNVIDPNIKVSQERQPNWEFSEKDFPRTI